MADTRARAAGDTIRLRDSINFKITAMAMICLVLGIAVVSGFSAFTKYRSFQATMERTKTQIIALIAKDISGGVRFKKADKISETFAGLEADPGFHGAYFAAFDPEGALIAETVVDPAFADFATDGLAETTANGAVSYRAVGATLTAAAPVVFGTSAEPIGYAVIVWDESDEFRSMVLQTTSILAGALVFGVLLLVAFSAAVRRSVIAPVKELTGEMAALADGRYDSDLAVAGRSDEIGAMARAIEVFKKSLIEGERLKAEQVSEASAKEQRQRVIETAIDEFESKARTAIGAVNSASDEMQQSAQALATIAEESTEKSGIVTASSEEASTNVQTVASAAEELASSIQEIGRQVSESAQMSAAAVTDAGRTGDQVQWLAEAAQKIGDVVALIEDIAEQTNLLALNATIEAARAGEAGRGFGVVAAEVKDLAAQTGKATEQISAQVAAIQSATDGTVTSIKEIATKIRSMDEITSAIAAAVEEQGAATDDIAQNIQRAATGTTEVSTTIVDIRQATEQTGTASASVLTASEQLADQAGILRGSVDEFLKKISAA